MSTIIDNSLLTALEATGLSDKEALVYATCLNRGELSIPQLITATKLSRSTLYFVADTLTSKGLLTCTSPDAHRSYTATDPRHLVNLLEHEKNEVIRRREQLQTILPLLHQQYQGVPNRPHVTQYVGQLEVHQLFDSILHDTPETLLGWGRAATLIQALGQEYLTLWLRRKSRMQLPVRALHEPTTAPVHIFIAPDTERTAPVGSRLLSYTLTYGSTVLSLVSLAEPHAVVAESFDMAETARSQFELLWLQSTP